MKNAIAIPVIVLLFMLTSVAGVALAARRPQGAAQLSQPGWCCIADQNRCVVRASMDDCTAAGGTVFNRDRDACALACRP